MDTPHHASESGSDGVDIRITPRRRPRASQPPLPGLFQSQRRRRRSSILFNELEDSLWFQNFVFFIIRYTLDILRAAVLMLRYPLAIVLAIWLLTFLSASCMDVIRDFMSPLCHIPVVGSVCLLMTKAPTAAPSSSQRADYPRLGDIQGRALDQLLVESAAGLVRDAEIRTVEMATTDLITLVKVSELNTGEILIDTLQDIAQNARRVEKSLNVLNARVNRAVDSIYAVNEHALRTIAEVERGSSILGFRWLFARQDDAEHVPDVTFEMVMGVLAAEMSEVILQCDATQSIFDKLGQDLAVLHEILTREFSSATKEKSYLLAALWTKLGGNKRQIVDVNARLTVLKELRSYRTDVKGHVGNSAQAVQTLTEDLEDLRARVAVPALVEERIPVEVQLRSIKTGLERLVMGRRGLREQYVVVEKISDMKGSPPAAAQRRS
ncbi:hypothetical protein NM688_g7937 [Phlebia brevispora]|uniref:Uncharacterized protein n=1 Tax=Phlebia brevispora TaxID=194682 RepID=A0ACC1RZI6_9APHY|nr:hypothetical protein NM688_g7937 [Phlebia brevispora]